MALKPCTPTKPNHHNEMVHGCSSTIGVNEKPAAEVIRYVLG